MNKNFIKNCDEYWLDEDGNSLVVAENGGVYIVTEDEEIIYITDDIRKIYDEEKDDYFIPSVVVGMCETILIQNKLKPFNMQKMLKQLFALDMIKAHWVLTDEVRYRPQKRIGKTRRRYITFYKKRLFKWLAEGAEI